MSVYYYLVCNDHRECVNGYKNHGLPMTDYVCHIPTFLARHSECKLSVASEHTDVDIEYRQWEDDDALHMLSCVEDECTHWSHIELPNPHE